MTGGTSSPAPEAASKRRRKTSAGRQRIEIRPIESAPARQVCFSKRRAGVFRKAAELSTLCGAHVAAVAFSPAGRPFCFGHPSVDSVVGRFLSSDGAANAAPADDAEAGVADELKRAHEAAVARVEAERARAGAVEAAVVRACAGKQYWWEANVDELGAEELRVFETALFRLRANVARRADAMLEDATMRRYQEWLSSS